MERIHPSTASGLPYCDAYMLFVLQVKALNMHWCCVDIIHLSHQPNGEHSAHYCSVNTNFVTPASTTETAIIPPMVSAFCRSHCVRSFIHFICNFFLFLFSHFFHIIVSRCDKLLDKSRRLTFCGALVCALTEKNIEYHAVVDDEKEKHIIECWAYGSHAYAAEVSSKYPAEFRCCIHSSPDFIQNV